MTDLESALERLAVAEEQLNVAIDRSESWKNLATKYKELAEARGEKIDLDRQEGRCRLCGEPTEVIVNIGLKKTPVCDSCCLAVTQQTHATDRGEPVRGGGRPEDVDRGEGPAVTVFERVETLLRQWQRNAPPLPPDARHLLRKLARQIALDAAAQCRQRSLGRPLGVKNESLKCADQLTHFLLCAEGEAVCLKCDGAGCPACGHEGVRKQGEARH